MKRFPYFDNSVIWTGSDILYLNPKKLRPDKPREENRVWYLSMYNSNIDLKCISLLTRYL